MTTLSPRNAYRLLAPAYNQAPNPLLALERRFTAAILPPLRHKQVLDAAAGTGHWSRYCKDRGANAVGLDLCPEMLDLAPSPRLVGDLRLLPVRDHSFDLTLCSFGIGYAPDAFSELVRVTRPGGSLVVSDVHPAALAAGWTRSFRHAEEVIHVEHQPYRIQDLCGPALRLELLVEPAFGEPERKLFEEAGKLTFFEAASSRPAIFIAHWIRS